MSESPHNRTSLPADLEERLRALENENEALKRDVARLQSENRRWARMAGTDAMTGLPNKISFSRALLPQSLDRAARESQSLGIVLLSAFLVIPAATAQLLAPGVRSMLLISIAVALISVVGGLWLSWMVNLPSGAAIVLLAAALFFLAMAGSRVVHRA